MTKATTNKKPIVFSDQIIVDQELARYIFSVIIENSIVSLRLTYLDTDDFQWSAFEKSTTTREEISIPDDVKQQALAELNTRTAFI